MLPVSFPKQLCSDRLTRTLGQSVAAQLAQSLDLNTLHALARTCRQFRMILLYYHRQLVNQTLRCTNDSDLPYVRDGLRNSKLPRSPPMVMFGMVCLTSGKAATCARDLVSECRRCGITVCRVRIQVAVFI